MSDVSTRIARLFVYPVKSCAGVELTQALLTETGLDLDRAWMVVDGQGEFVSQRELPRMALVKVQLKHYEVVLRAPDASIVPVGEVGEITVRSEHMMESYWKRPEETAKVLRDGWLWTGDLATCDAEGFITLAGRSKEMLISGGYNIYPQEIEALLTSHPSVLEAAVVGVPDPDWGEIAIAYVSPVPNAQLDSGLLQTHCKPILGFKTPKEFRFLDALPKNPNGKVDKPMLKAAALREHGDKTHV